LNDWIIKDGNGLSVCIEEQFGQEYQGIPAEG